MALPFPDIPPTVFPPVGPFDVAGHALGPFAIKWYAIAYIAGILLGWRYAVTLVRNVRLWGGRSPTLTAPQVDDLVLWVALGVILGGRIGYVLFYMLPLAEQRAELIANPFVVFEVWKGGMSFHGGAIGVLLAVILFARGVKANLLRVADIVVAAQPIGQFFGRIANFINGELWGRKTDVPWGMVFCGKYVDTYPDGSCVAGLAARHPSQLYEAVLEGLVVFLVLRLATHRWGWLQRSGAVLGLFMTLYGTFRILLEFTRNPDPGLDHLPLSLTMGIILSVPMVLAGGFLIWRALKEPLPPPELATAP